MEILNLAENLIRLRREKGITQEELAQFVGVTKASISKWETSVGVDKIADRKCGGSYSGAGRTCRS